MAEQTYANPASRNQVAANGAKPGKVSVPMPGVNETQKPYHGGMKQNPPGFNQGVKEGKVKI